eukprot:g2513.t1
MAVSTFAIRIAGAALAYLSQIVLARLLGAHDYGIYSVAWTFVIVLGVMACGGFSSSASRFIPQYRQGGDEDALRGFLRTSGQVAFFIGAATAGIGIVLVYLLSGAIDPSYVLPLMVILLALPFFAFGLVQDGIARSYDWTFLAMLPTYIWRPLTILVLLLAAVLLAGYQGNALTAALVAVSATVLVAAYQYLHLRKRLLPRLPSGPRRADLKTWLVISLPMLMVDGFLQLITSADVIMVSFFQDPDEVAVYFAASRTLALVHFVYFAVRAASAHRFSRYTHDRDQSGLSAYVAQATHWTFWPSLLAGAGLLLIAPFLLKLFGSGFEAGYPLIALLMIGVLARASVGPADALLTMTGHQNSCAGSNLLTADPISSEAHEVVRFDPLSEEVPMANWRELTRLARDPNPFFGPDFLQPFLKHLQPKGVQLLALRERAEGRWLLAAPVGRRRQGLAMRVNSTWATEYAPLGTPLIHSAASDDAIRAFLSAGAEPGGLFAIPYLLLGSESAARLKRAALQKTVEFARSARASHDAAATGEAQLAQADSGKRRKEMRRLLRRLGDHGEVRFVSLSGQQTLQGFEAFLQLEASGWKGRAGTALLNLPETAAFARLAIAQSAAESGVRIDQLWAGETLVAALVLFHEGGQVFSWKIAFDERFARYSPGAQIALQALRTNLAMEGFKGADSLAIPGHSMIEPLWRGRLDIGTLLYAEGPLSNVKRTLCVADARLEQTLRMGARALKRRLKS